jgi:hypothetical protein
MATVLSLAMKISADATGVRQSLSPVERALQQLDKEAAGVTAAFKKFGSESAAAVAAQEKFDVRVRALTESLRAGLTSPQDYARSLEQLQAAANETADDLQRASQIIEANLTRQEVAQRNYERSIAELNRLREAGLLDETQYGLAVQRSADAFAKATVEANKYGAAVDNAGDGGALKFNELSGVLSALPGPIGNVAGRLSGLSSAGEGLARVFGGGLSQGLSGIGAAVAGLINPFTAGAAAVAGFGAAATAITRGLTALEDRVENLGNTADKLGISFGFVQTLEESARRSGTSIESVSAAFGRLQRSVTGVDEESKAAQQALANLGVTAEQIQGLKPEEQYLLIGERLNSIEDPARRSATAISLLGRAGADLLPFFRNLGGAADDLRGVGAALSDQQRRDADDFGAALDRLSVAAQGAGQQLNAAFAGAGERIANALAEATGAVAKFLDEQNKLNRVSGELQRLRQEIASVQAGPITDAQIAAIEAGQTAEQVLAAARGEVVELRDAIEEPISPELAKSLADAAASVEKAKVEALRFGEEGFNAAVRFEAEIANLQDGLDRGLFNETTFRNEAAKAGEAFKSELAKIEEDNKLDIQVNEDAAAALAGLNEEISRAIAGAAQFGQEGFDAALQFQTKVEELRTQFERGIINEEALAQGVRAANEEYDGQIDKIRKVVEEKRNLVDEDSKVIESLLRSSSAADEVQANIDAVSRQQQRLLEQLAQAREKDNAAAAAAIGDQLTQLDSLQAKLVDQRQAAAQGFEDGFKRVFDDINRSVEGVIEKAGELGTAGEDAARRFTQVIEGAQQLAQDGTITKEQLEQQVAFQQKAFEKEVANIKKAADERLRVEQQVNQLIVQNLSPQEQARIKAAENLKLVEQEIRNVQEQAIAARKADDKEALAAANRRLAQLDQIGAKERDIVNGAAAQRELFQARQRQIVEDQAKQQEEIQKQQQQFAEEQARIQQAEFERQTKRIAELNTLGPRTVQTADVRTAEGQQLVLDLFNQQQDPQLIELKQANKVSRQILNALAANLNRIGLPVGIP